MSNLPSYLTSAKPIPASKRAPWYKTIMPAYIGVMLWFVFWQDVPTGGMDPAPPYGMLSQGVVTAFVGLIIAAVICHFLFYMAPAMLGMSTGLPLYVVGTSTYGATGGLFMPGLLMGLLQFGWLAVNGYFVAEILCRCFGIDGTVPGWPHGIIATAYIILAAFVGLKGISYVGRVGTYLPLIPIAVLLLLVVFAFRGGEEWNEDNSINLYPVVELIVVDESSPAEDIELYTRQQKMRERQIAEYKSRPAPYSSVLQIFGIMCVYVVGFFATAGAAGADIAMNSRSREDVHIGGVSGILLPTVLAGEAAMFIVVLAYGGKMIPPEAVGEYNPVKLMKYIFKNDTLTNIAMIGLAISAFPGACFASFIAANSFKTTMPRISPFVSVGLGALAAAFLAVTGWVGQVIWVFVLIGASFGPVCGAMLADYLMAGRKWSGPRAGFNPAGWISWIVGFIVGAFNLAVNMMSNWEWANNMFPNLEHYQNYVPVSPVTAFLVGFALYVLLSVVGLRTRIVATPTETE